MQHNPITRRRFIGAGAAGLLATTWDQRVWSLPPAQRPNVLFIVTDQHPVSCVGAYGNARLKTPHLDRLAHEGALFSNFHIVAFPCSPSRASYFTGQYAHTHGVETNDTPLREDIPSLGNVFKAAGYQTAYLGKWHLGGNMYARTAQDRWSFRRVDDPHYFKFEKGGPWRGGEDLPQCGFTDKWLGGWEQFRQQLRAAGLGALMEKDPNLGCHNMSPSGPEGTHIYSQVPAAHHEAAFTCGNAEKFIRAERDPTKPFCMVVSLYGPHLPVAPPQPWDTMYPPQDVPLPENHDDMLVNKPYAQRQNSHCYKRPTWSAEQFRDYVSRYWGYCSYLDHEIGRVLTALDDTGEMDHTIVVFTADHGDMVAAHDMIFKLGSCGYDELLRVPFLMRYPPAVRARFVSDALVESADVFPTLLALTGVPIPGTVQGRSFADVLSGQAESFRTVVHSDFVNTSLIVRTKDWKYISNWKQGDLDELYDMNARPLELTNLAADPTQTERVQAMRGLIVAWLKESRNPYVETLSQAVMAPAADIPVLEPHVASFKQGVTKAGQPVAEFEIAWKVVRPLPPDSKYWCFIHVTPPAGARRKQGDGILTRCTKWPEEPAGRWQAGTEYNLGTMPVPIPPDMKPGGYAVATGLFNPDEKKNPPMRGGAHIPLGTLHIVKRDADKIVLTFEPIN